LGVKSLFFGNNEKVWLREGFNPSKGGQVLKMLNLYNDKMGIQK